MEAKLLTFFMLIFVNVLLPSEADVEPRACKLSYEEQLLEKVVRTEVKVEAMLDEIRKSYQGHQMQEVYNTLTDLKKTQDGQERKINDAVADNGLLKQRINVIQESGVGQSQIVAFRANTLKDVSISNGQTLVFVTTVFDKGLGYDNTTGLYIAPVSGVYLFSLQLCIWVDKFVYLEIVSEGATVNKVRFVDEGQTFHSCSTLSGVAILRAGDTVWVRSKQSSTGSNVWEDNELIWNTFSGVLINAMN